MYEKPRSEDLDAGDAFRQSMVSRADSDNHGAPLWYGWVIMDAFLAGVDHARKTGKETPKMTAEAKEANDRNCNRHGEAHRVPGGADRRSLPRGR